MDETMYIEEFHRRRRVRSFFSPNFYAGRILSQNARQSTNWIHSGAVLMA